jgi:hypothetical protein
MDEKLFKQRTKQLALRIIKTVEVLPKNRTTEVALIRTLQKRDGSSPINRQSKIENLK